MLKKEITYTDLFTDEKRTETFYFNLTKTELKEMQFGQEGGFTHAIERAMDNADERTLFIEFRKLILATYGVRGENGRFIKGPEVAHEFTQTPAYDVLFSEITETPGALQKFITGVMPEEVMANINWADIEAQVDERYGGSTPAPNPPSTQNVFNPPEAQNG